MPTPANEGAGPDKNMLAPSAILSTNRGLRRAKAPPFCLFLFPTFLAVMRATNPGRKLPPRCRRRTLRGMMMIVSRHRSQVFLSHSGEPFLSHLAIDSLSVLTRDPVPGTFEFGAQTLGERLLGSLVFDEFARKIGDPFSHSEPWQESPLLTFSSSSVSRSFASCSSGRHGVKKDDVGRVVTFLYVT